MGLAEWFVLALTILFLAYFAYATPIIMVGIWHYKKHGFGDDAPGDDWDPPNVSVLVPLKNEERVVGRLLDALTRLDYPGENLEVIVVEDGPRTGRWKSAGNFLDDSRGLKSPIGKQAMGRVTPSTLPFTSLVGKLLRRLMPMMFQSHRQSGKLCDISISRRLARFTATIER